MTTSILDLFVAATIDVDAVAQCLAAGADANESRGGLSALHFASASKDVTSVNALLDAGADSDPEAWPTQGDLKSPEWRWLGARAHRDLLGEYGIGARGLTPLHVACDAGDALIIQRLLGGGADPYVGVLLDGGPEGDWLWTPDGLVSGQRDDLLVHASHREALRVLRDWMALHGPSTRTAVRQRLREERMLI